MGLDEHDKTEVLLLHQCESLPRILSTFPTPLQTLPVDDTEHLVENYPALDEFSSNPAGHFPANYDQTSSGPLPSAQPRANGLSVLHTAPQPPASQGHPTVLLNRCSIASCTPAAACQTNTPGTYSPIPVIQQLLYPTPL